MFNGQYVSFGYANDFALSRWQAITRMVTWKMLVRLDS